MTEFPSLADMMMYPVTISGNPEFHPKKHFKASPAQQQRVARKLKNIRARKKKRF